MYIFLKITHGNVHKKIVASRCIDNRSRIESLTSESDREVPRDSHHYREVSIGLWR